MSKLLLLLNCTRVFAKTHGAGRSSPKWSIDKEFQQCRFPSSALSNDNHCHLRSAGCMVMMTPKMLRPGKSIKTRKRLKYDGAAAAAAADDDDKEEEEDAHDDGGGGGGDDDDDDDAY